jgi:hypothetical protein
MPNGWEEKMKKEIDFFVDIVKFFVIMLMGLFFLILQLFVSFVLPVKITIKEMLFGYEEI